MLKRNAYKLLAERYIQITEKEEAQLMPLTENEVDILSQIGFTYYIKDRAAIRTEQDGKDIAVKHYNNGYYELLESINGQIEVYDYKEFEDLVDKIIS
jgi:hypothetical protein